MRRLCCFYWRHTFLCQKVAVADPSTTSGGFIGTGATLGSHTAVDLPCLDISVVVTRLNDWENTNKHTLVLTVTLCDPGITCYPALTRPAIISTTTWIPALHPHGGLLKGALWAWRWRWSASVGRSQEPLCHGLFVLHCRQQDSFSVSAGLHQGCLF